MALLITVSLCLSLLPVSVSADSASEVPGNSAGNLTFSSGSGEIEDTENDLSQEDDKQSEAADLSDEETAVSDSSEEGGSDDSAGNSSDHTAENAGNTTDKSSDDMLEESDETMNASDSDTTNIFTIDASGTTRKMIVTNPAENYSGMTVAVWSAEDGQDDLNWYKMTKNADGSWEYDFSTSNLYHSGTCYAHVYASVGNAAGVNICQASFTVSEDEAGEAPLVISKTGEIRTVKLNTGKNCTAMRAAVWSAEGGQDDLYWYTMHQRSDGAWTVQISSKHLKHSGKVYVHIYSGTSVYKYEAGTTIVYTEDEMTGNSVTVSEKGTERTVAASVQDSSVKRVVAAVWSAEGGQDDLTWYSMEKNSDGLWTTEITSGNLAHSGTVYIHVYSGSGNMTFVGGVSAAFSDQEIRKNSVEVSESGSIRTVTATTKNASVTAMVAAVWSSAGGQDDLKWYSMKQNADGTWTTEISSYNLAHSGNVNVHIYSGSSKLTYVDGTTTVFSEDEMGKNAVEITGSGSVRTVTATTKNADVTKLVAAVWSKENDQDDLTWYTMKKNADGTWTVDITSADLRECGDVYVHVYSVSDKYVYIAGLTTTFAQSEMLNYVTVTGSGATRKVTAVTSYSCTGMRVAVWSKKDDQDDLNWYTMTKQADGTWTATIKGSRLYHSGTCYAHVYTNTNKLVNMASFTIEGDYIAKNAISITGSGASKQIKLINPQGSYSSVTAAVWSSASDQDDLTWNKMTRNSDGSWSLNFSLRNLKHSGTINVHIYADNTLIAYRTAAVSDSDYFQTLLTYSTGSDSGIDFVRCAINIANNDAIGYGHTWPRTISCAGLVGLSLTYCGYGDFIKNDPKGWGYIDLGAEYVSTLLNEVGAVELTGPFNASNCGSLQPGDLLYYYYSDSNNHIAIYLGNGYTVEARGPQGSSDADTDGYEVAVYNLYSSPITFQKAYRIRNLH